MNSLQSFDFSDAINPFRGKSEEFDFTGAVNPFSRELAEIDFQANEAATSPENDLPEPSDAQKEAGNYKKGRIEVHGLKIAIENPKGSVRSGTDPDGKKWESKIHYHYGDLTGTKGADGDALDVFVGPDLESESVFVIDQVTSEGVFDEHKIMLAFSDRALAIEGYLKNYDPDWKVGPITAMTITEFKDWLKGDTTKPLHGQSHFSDASDPEGKAESFPNRLKATIAGKSAQKEGKIFDFEVVPSGGEYMLKPVARPLEDIVVSVKPYKARIQETGQVETLDVNTADEALKEVERRASLLNKLLECAGR